MSALRTRAALAITLLALAALAGCGERAQTAGGPTVGKKGDAAPWQGLAEGGIAAPGWKAGDPKVWEEQMRSRMQNQNEYTRMTAAR